MAEWGQTEAAKPRRREREAREWPEWLQWLDWISCFGCGCAPFFVLVLLMAVLVVGSSCG